MEESPVTVEIIPGRGRGLKTTRSIAAGEVLLAESPVCWWVDPAARDRVCAWCLNPLSAGCSTHSCEECGVTHWCSDSCLRDDSERHSHVCRMLGASRALPAAQSWETHGLQGMLAIVGHLAALQQLSTVDWDLFWDQHCDVLPLSDEEKSCCVQVADILVTCGMAVDSQFAEACYRRDRSNGSTFTMPLIDPSTEREARAHAVYPTLAMLNHSCMPTAARFDQMDGPCRLMESLPAAACVGALKHAVTRLSEQDIKAYGNPPIHPGVLSTDERPLMRPPHSLVTCFVAMHALPQECELMHSYVPLDSPYDERKEHMLSDYGFECSCDRCQFEKNLECETDEYEEQGDYIMLWITKHCCPCCAGTMAQLPDGAQIDGCVCNRCGSIRTDQEFELQLAGEFWENDDEEDDESNGSEDDSVGSQNAGGGSMSDEDQ